ncbi:MAG: alginate lyase family protein [Armatimonadetes bacterium]|nr:alginate lyase family protein [Armatimonadota bacterium]
MIVLLMGVVCGTPGQAQEPANLIPNGGFEIDADGDGIPDSWKLSLGATERPGTAGLAGQPRSGERCLCVVRTPGGGQAGLTSPDFALKPGAAYQVSVWLRVEGRSSQDTVTLRVAMDAGRKAFEFHVGRAWQRFTATFVTPEGATTASLQFQGLAGAADRLYLDDVAVTQTAVDEAEGLETPVHQTDLAGFEFPPGRPRLEHTAAEIEEMKQAWAGRNIREHEWVRRAEPWLERQLHFFEEGYDFSKFFTIGQNCPEDATGLRPIIHPDGSQEMECPKCGRTYRGEAHRGCARAMFNQSMAEGARELARAYALTGDLRYARRAAEILRGFAGRYKAWGGGGHAVLYILRESYGFLVPCTTAYDYIYDSGVLSAEDKRKIEEDFFRVAGEYYTRAADSNAGTNRAAIHNHSVMCIGVAISDKTFVNQAINSPRSGVHTLLARLFLPEGICWEGLGYQTYTISGLSPISEMAHRVGINVYRDPVYRRVFEGPLKLLFPGQQIMPEAYRLASRRLAALGEPMEYPFGDTDAPAHVPSHNFGQFGAGVLRSKEGPDQIYLSMEYGREAMFMGHAPGVKFSLGLYANGRMLTPRASADYGKALCGGWSRRSLAHNTITVDDRDQWGRTVAGPAPEYARRRLVAFETAPRVKVVRAADDQVYGDVTLDRALFLTDRYVVDLSGARAAGGRHRFDLCYRNYGDLDCGLPFRPVKGSLGAGHGYEYLTDAGSARTVASWSADWRQAPDSALRLLVPGGPETEVIACTTPDNQDAEKPVYAILARRWGEATVFVSVWEPHRDGPEVVSTRRLPVAQGDSEGVGVEVVRQGQPGAECFLAAYAPGTRQYGDIELDGKIASGRWRDARAAPDYAQLVKGVLLRRGTRSLEANIPATLYVEQLAPDRLLLKTGSESAGTLTLTGTFPGGAKVTRDGEAVAARVEGERTLTFAVAPETSCEVAGVTDWQRIRLEREGRVEEPGQAEEIPVVETPSPEPAIQAALAPDGTLAGKNKLLNAGFEVDPRTIPDADGLWDARSSYHLARFRAAHEYDAEVARSGGRSLKIPEVNWANEATRDGWIEQRVPGVGAGKTYTLSAWVKSSPAPTRARLCIYGWNPKWGSDYEGGVSPVFDVGKEWQRITWTRSFGPDITEVRVMVKREHQVLGGDLWIDDVQLEEGDAATLFAPDAWTEGVQRQTPEKPGS